MRGLNKIGSTKDSILQMSIFECEAKKACVTQIGSVEIHLTEITVKKNRVAQVRLAHIDLSKVARCKMGAAKVRTIKTGLDRVAVPQKGTLEVDRSQVVLSKDHVFEETVAEVSNKPHPLGCFPGIPFCGSPMELVDMLLVCHVIGPSRFSSKHFLQYKCWRSIMEGERVTTRSQLWVSLGCFWIWTAHWQSATITLEWLFRDSGF